MAGSCNCGFPCSWIHYRLSAERDLSTVFHSSIPAKMEEIRVFSEEHVSDVANLYLKAVRGQSRPAPQHLQAYFREIYFGNPWVSPEISPLVFMSNGKLIGFLGVIPRTMEFRGRPIRVAAVSPFMVDREQSQGLAGMKLLRHLFNGPQDLSFTDGAANEASTVFTAAGARISRVYSFNWVRLLRPFETARGLFDRVGGGLAKLKGVAGLVTAPMDLLLSKVPLGMLQRPKSLYSSRQASAPELLECIREARGRESLKPVYTMPSFGWLMSEAGKGPGHKGFRMMTAYSPDGVRCGWFVYYAQPGRAAYVLQVGALRQLQFKDVLLALFQDAWEQGASALKGQAIPQFLTTLTEQYCLFRQPYSCVVGYARDPEIMNAFQCGDASLSRLDAGSWLRFSSENWI